MKRQYVEFDVNSKEYEMLINRAKRAGVSLNDYLRAQITAFLNR